MTTCLSFLLLKYVTASTSPFQSASSNCLIVPPVKLSTAGSRSFAVAAPHIWNGQPNGITPADSDIHVAAWSPDATVHWIKARAVWWPEYWRFTSATLSCMTSWCTVLLEQEYITGCWESCRLQHLSSWRPDRRHWHDSGFEKSRRHHPMSVTYMLVPSHSQWQFH